MSDGTRVTLKRCQGAHCGHRLLGPTSFRRTWNAGGRAGDVERARRLIVRSFMGFGSDALCDTVPRGMRTRASTHAQFTPTGFRSNSNRSGTTPAHDWGNWPDQVAAFCARLATVVIENRAAVDVIAQHDSDEALIYCDPPYVHSTRRSRKKGDGGGYTHEMVDEDHRALATTLHAASGMVVVSGYASDLYDLELYPEWERHERAHLADGARKRTEVVWLNDACVAALRADRDQHTLDMVGA